MPASKYAICSWSIGSMESVNLTARPGKFGIQLVIADFRQCPNVLLSTFRAFDICPFFPGLGHRGAFGAPVTLSGFFEIRCRLVGTLLLFDFL